MKKKYIFLGMMVLIILIISVFVFADKYFASDKCEEFVYYGKQILKPITIERTRNTFVYVYNIGNSSNYWAKSGTEKYNTTTYIPITKTNTIT